jgi:glutamate-ammonia-ligase adenylyltransferase
MLARIGELEMLPPDWIGQLREAYIHLRTLEHAIQGLADRQTQMLPADEQERQRIAWAMGCADWAQVSAQCQRHRASVAAVFQDFLHDSEQEAEAEDQHDLLRWLALWRRLDERESWLAALGEAGFEAPEDSWQHLREVRDSRGYGAMSADALQRFERFLPLLLETLRGCERPSLTMQRVLSLIKVILGRTVYLVLLYENRQALQQLCRLCSDSPWVAEHLAKSPVILDELVDIASLYHLPPRHELSDELRQRLLRVPEDDLEAQMDALRTFKQSHMLRVAASELGGHLPLMKVSDYLTWLAEAILEQALNISWRQMVTRHGVPEGASDCVSIEGFAIIAYGKLGGIELSYSSDLDMVFLYDAEDYGSTDGERPLNNQQFFTRLGQKLLHLLSTRTTQGLLYETDMRLRPSGNSGMLVASLAAFERYQQKDAWTWEHQALVRSRFVAGDPRVAQGFERVRHDILVRPREREVLRAEVLGMRQKMRQSAVGKYGSEQKARDHIKQGEGGLIDIEFITQYGTLLFAREHPDLLRWSDNIRLLEVLQRDRCFDPEDMAFLQDAYRALRTALHRKSLAGEDFDPDLSDFAETRARVSRIWRGIFES